ncbi:MAG: zinc-ribbon domain containing protein [bacterium]|nr:zinc-ribbon domain containing protein [bacterium]
MTDKTVVCCNCGEEFVFTAGEQEFYTTKGLSEPKRCKKCREAYKASKNNR